MTFHQVGKASEQKSSPPASSSWPSVTAAVLLPSVGEEQKGSNNELNKSHPRRATMHGTMLAAISQRAQEGVPCHKDPSEKLGQKLPWGQCQLCWHW